MGRSRQARGRQKGQLEFGPKGAVEIILADEVVFQHKFIGRHPGRLSEDHSLAQGFRRMPVMGQEADLDRQCC
jgi:hypothetical protein